MDLLKKEMERKKKAMALAKERSSSSSSSSSLSSSFRSKRRYMKASELRELQEEEEDDMRRKRQREEENTVNKETSSGGERKEEERGDDSSHPSQEEGDKSQTRLKSSEKQLTSTSASTSASTSTSDSHIIKKKRTDSIVDLSEDQIVERLRSFGIPIKLFGETFDERRLRVRSALDHHNSQNATQSEMDEYRLGLGHQIRNTFLEKDKKKEDPQTIAMDDKKKQKPKQNEQDEDTSNDPHKRIYKYFKGLLRQWEEELALRPEAVKRTAAGKTEVKTHKQCRDYIRPLFKLCKSRKLEQSMLDHIIKIVDFCQAGEFVRAHDAYIDVAIGRAAWPIGVTMVGIHARSGRAKIESANVAHVMNSELQRKFLTSVKRLMTYAQNKSSVAPSKKVMN